MLSQLDENIRKADRFLERFRQHGVLHQLGGEAVAAADGATFVTSSPIDCR